MLLLRISMARRCDICGRGSQKDFARSHSNIKTVQRQYINLQVKKIDGAKKKVCTKCIKTMAKVKPVTKAKPKTK